MCDKCNWVIITQIVNIILWYKIYVQVKYKEKGSVSGSGTGPGDKGSRGPALPDPETFPYEWLGARQYISMHCVSCL